MAPFLKEGSRNHRPLNVAKVKSWTEEETQRRRLDYLLARPRDVFAACTIFIGLAVLMLFITGLTDQAWLAWASFGACIGGGAVYVLRLIDDVSGARTTIIGRDGELSTKDELLKIPGAIVIPGPRFGKVDIDHVLICPDGVYAVETKLTSLEVSTGSRFADRHLRDFISDARNRCQKLQNLLSGRGVEVQVQPMLVLWGYRVADLPGGAMVAGGTLVAVGRQSPQWRSLFKRAVISVELSQSIQQVIGDSQKSLPSSRLSLRSRRLPAAQSQGPPHTHGV